MFQINPRTVSPIGPPQEAAPTTESAPIATPFAQVARVSGATGADLAARFGALFGSAPPAFAFYADQGGNSGGATKQSTVAGALTGGAHPPTLRAGSSGPAVRALQHQLNQWRAEQWPKQAPIAENGRFDSKTKQAVADFQKANGIQTGRRQLDLTPNGIADVRVQNRLRLENDPAFTRLDADDKELARAIVTSAHLDGARSEPMFTLLASPSFAGIGESARHAMLETLAYHELHPEPAALTDAALVTEYTRLAGDPAFQKLTPSIQATVVSRLTHIARPMVSVAGLDMPALIRTGIENLKRVSTSPEFGKLPADDQRLVLKALQHEFDDTGVAKAVGSLLRSPRFEALSAEQKTAVLSQVANYPDDRAIGNLERLLAKAWFQGQSLDDQQRSLKAVADLSQHNRGDRDVIDNTLDKLLAAGSDLKLQWGTLSPSTVFGEGNSLTRTLTLSVSRVPAGNQPVPDNWDGRHLVLHTIAHEVSHIVNRDVTRSSSFQHFEIEYRAWAVGFKAEFGHWPTNKEAMERVAHELTAKRGGYEDIKNATGHYHEAMAIFGFLEQLTGLQVNGGNLEDVLKSNPDHWRNWSRYPDDQGKKQSDRPAPLADGNLDNR